MVFVLIFCECEGSKYYLLELRWPFHQEIRNSIHPGKSMLPGQLFYSSLSDGQVVLLIEKGAYVRYTLICLLVDLIRSCRAMTLALVYI